MRFRELAIATLMAMPEASVNENDLGQTRKDDVRFAGQVFNMQPEPISESVGKAPYNDLGLGVLTANGSHNCGALGGGSRVGHDFHHARM